MDKFDFSRMLHKRPRRLRKSPVIRDIVAETNLTADDFVAPLFVMDGSMKPLPIESMPEQFRFNIEDLLLEIEHHLKVGIRAFALFPAIEDNLKDATGSEALNEKTLILRAISEAKKRFPEAMLITDIALDPYTSHGHDGIFKADGSDINNDATVIILQKMSVLAAAAGADFVAPSDMMDGRISAIRHALDANAFSETGIIAYSAKYASAFYGPFRDAIGSSAAAGTRLLNKYTYQLNPANRREALREIALDEDEGADVLMIKPAGAYLDIIREVKNVTNLPVAAYQVSGEYSQIHAAAKLGWLDLQKTRNESLLAIKRAGADFIFSYFAKSFASDLIKTVKYP